jgi:hypothetical protein
MRLRSLLEFAEDSAGFVRERKRIWLLPLLVVLLLAGTFLVFVSGSAAAPFIYALF